MHVGPGFLLLNTALFIPLSAQPAAPQPKPLTPEVSAWQSRVPELRTMLESHGDRCHDSWPVGIVGAAALGSPSHASIALVEYCNGGAYTVDIAAVRLQNGQPVQAMVRLPSGEITPGEFGRGASVMHSVDVKLVPERNAIYDIHEDGKGDAHGEVHRTDCIVTAYVWNPNTEMLEWNRTLSREATRSYCSTLQTNWRR